MVAASKLFSTFALNLGRSCFNLLNIGSQSSLENVEICTTKRNTHVIRRRRDLTVMEWRFKTDLESTEEDVVFLVNDAVFRDDATEHRNEDQVAFVELERQ